MDFENLTPQKIKTLCNCLATLEVKRVDIIRNRYSQFESSFDDALELFYELGLVTQANNTLRLEQDFERWLVETRQNNFSIRTIRAFFADKILARSKGLSIKIVEFFEKFVKAESDLVFFPSNEERLRFANIRNLFVGLGVIEVSKDGRRYKVAASFIDSIRHLLMPAPISPAKLTSLLKQQELAGKVAEEFMLGFEKKRLISHPELASKIMHTSKINASAGYDIESFQGPDCPNEPSYPRYIEVKAVSPQNYEFFWSHNEITVAQQLMANYFLYLVPMIKNHCKVKDLIIIRDPQSYFSQAGDKWISCYEIMRIRKNYSHERIT